jgi:hypothetical protein
VSARSQARYQKRLTPYDQCRKLFTIAEPKLLENHDFDEHFVEMGFAPLPVVQKAKVRFLTSEAQATGAGPIGINLASQKLAVALTQLVAYGAIDELRKAEILAGTQKS